MDIKYTAKFGRYYLVTLVWEKEVYRFNISDNNLYIIIK